MEHWWAPRNVVLLSVTQEQQESKAFCVIMCKHTPLRAAVNQRSLQTPSLSNQAEGGTLTPTAGNPQSVGQVVPCMYK